MAAAAKKVFARLLWRRRPAGAAVVLPSAHDGVADRESSHAELHWYSPTSRERCCRDPRLFEKQADASETPHVSASREPVSPFAAGTPTHRLERSLLRVVSPSQCSCSQ